MDASTRPDDDTLRNLSANENVIRGMASLAAADRAANGTAHDPLDGFDKERATDTEVADALRNLSEVVTSIRQREPDMNKWSDRDWDWDLALQELKRETELRETIIRDRQRGFTIDPRLHRASLNEAFAWARDNLGVKANGRKFDLDITPDNESSDERRRREANPDIPVVASVNALWMIVGRPVYEREQRLFKATPEEAHAKSIEALKSAALTKDEQNMLMGVGQQMYEEEQRRVKNREKVRQHREKYALTGDYIYRDAFPDDWSEEDILRYLSPPEPETDTANQPKSRKEKDRDRKRAARAAAKKPVEGSNEEWEPQLAPLPYRQKMAAIKARISKSVLSWTELHNLDVLLDVMLMGTKSSAWEQAFTVLDDWASGVFEDEGGPAAPEPTPEEVEEQEREKAASDERYRRYKADKAAREAGHELPDYDNQLTLLDLLD